MIKVNLASRMNSEIVGSTGNALNLSMFGLDQLDLEQLKDLPIKKLLLPIVVGLLASNGLESFKADSINKLDKILKKQSEQNKKLQTESSKFKNYESVKTALDEDESTIKTKLDTIKKLVEGRSTPLKILLGVVSSIPKDAWLSQLSLNSSKLNLKGSVFEFNQISDFMKNLNENSIFSEVNLTKSEQHKDQSSGLSYADFEFEVKRRSTQ